MCVNLTCVFVMFIHKFFFVEKLIITYMHTDVIKMCQNVCVWGVIYKKFLHIMYILCSVAIII